MKDVSKIAISGELGSGKTVLGKKLSEYLGYKLISVGGIQRKLAEKYGMNTTEFNKYMETHPHIDLECDQMVEELGKTSDKIILDSRLAWYFVPQSFKIHLIVDKNIASERIFNDNIRVNEKYENIQQTIQSMIERRSSEVLRFKQQYGIDIDNLKNYNLVIDTSYATPDDIFEKVIECFELWKEDKDYNSIWISPRNLIISSNSDNTSSTDIIIEKKDGSFHVIKGQNNLKKYNINKPFVPVIL